MRVVVDSLTSLTVAAREEEGRAVGVRRGHEAALLGSLKPLAV